MRNLSLESVPRAKDALLPSVDTNAPAFPFVATSKVYVDASVTPENVALYCEKV